MAKQDPNNGYNPRKELGAIIDELDLSTRDKLFIKSRWLDQLLWLEGRAKKDKEKYLRLRIITIIGGVIVPALVSLNNIDSPRLRNFIGWITFSMSLTVAVSAAVEEFFQYGQSFTRYRNTAEGMKIEGWSFFQLSGPYEDAPNHQAAYKTFAAHVENIIKKDVEGYNAEMMKKQEKQDGEGEEQASAKDTSAEADTENAADTNAADTTVDAAGTVVEDNAEA